MNFKMAQKPQPQIQEQTRKNKQKEEQTGRNWQVCSSLSIVPHAGIEPCDNQDWRLSNRDVEVTGIGIRSLPHPRRWPLRLRVSANYFPVTVHF